MENLKLQKIATKYQSINYNEDNYSIGGGLSGNAFASRRHEDAKFDAGKLTEGEATQLFKKATGADLDLVKAIINYAVPHMEWHHAGKLPKAYGGGMKKTYFLNATEIVDLATNWAAYCEKYTLHLAAKSDLEAQKRSLEARKLEFLTSNAQKLTRVSNSQTGVFFVKTAQEIEGKYGWFDSTYKSYNLPEYFSGWKFESEEKYHEFLNIK
jgi:hypothetical protein